MLKGKKILLAVTGSIAAYKVPALVRLLVKEGAEVKVIMTPAATQFVAPLTLSTLSKNEVLYELSENNSWSNHVMLGRWADLMLVAPLSCNSLAKMANGLCDNLFTAVYLSSVCKVVVAPAMDEDMWMHPSTQNNIQKIESFSNYVIPVEKGELASGLVGSGRMAEPDHIVEWLDRYFSLQHQLKGKRVLVTAGPTHEAIDPVRFIGNHSSGKMGVALAAAFAARGAKVTLVCGPVQVDVPHNINVIKVTSAAQMYTACMEVFPDCDIAVMSAAVADYTIEFVSEQKIKKSEDELKLTLTKTKDILKSLGSIKKDHQLLVGFALETENEKANAVSKLHQKNADFIVMNSLNDKGAGFGSDTNKITIFDKSGKEIEFELLPKKQLADVIINTILK
jgi:phosphopantothenoylcysteine decarboxylase/phosphopantothenate--cysteine ligase